MSLEQDLQELRLAEQEIARQSLEDKDRRILELESKVEVLEGMLNRLATQRAAYPQPLPQPLPTFKQQPPKRWSVR